MRVCRLSVSGLSNSPQTCLRRQRPTDHVVPPPPRQSLPTSPTLLYPKLLLTFSLPHAARHPPATCATLQARGAETLADLVLDGSCCAAGQQHDDAHDSARNGHRRFPLARPWEFEVNPQRVNLLTSETPPRVSAFDAISSLLRAGNPWQVWGDLSRQFPEFSQLVEDFKFPGPGQRPTQPIHEEVSTLCANLKFPGPGQRPTQPIHEEVSTLCTNLKFLGEANGRRLRPTFAGSCAPSCCCLAAPPRPSGRRREFAPRTAGQIAQQ